ncbi:hypothetical protein CFC21_112048 [Triticum aestivum]|uniref:Uncharacterized protein n=2 Tax=Triticum aestivum TaxID=4565 RepID=A0A3B6TT83_WHEAT|nr:uncharacterized protein LOC123165922 [Triticum aestivum]KAF7112114.1 hypothetical protein CFC21_112048 [Triticum aestivum]
MDVLSRRFALFGFIAGWSIATSGETGPTFQLALALVSCIYFLNDKMKKPWQGVCYRAWTLCEWLDSRFTGSPSDPGIYFAAYLVSGAPYFAGCLCIFILGLHPLVTFHPLMSKTNNFV